MIKDEHFVPEFGLDIEKYKEADNMTGAQHLIRYLWVIDLLSEYDSVNSIIDIACGSGYGSYLLAEKYKYIQVLGVDYDPAAIKYAKTNFLRPNLSFKVGDICRWSEMIGGQEYDCIISFDTIEHVLHREIMMQNVVDHMNKESLFILSTPLTSEIKFVPEWEYHKIEYSFSSLFDFLRRYFETILRPENNTLPKVEVFHCLRNTKAEYLLIMNPLLCKKPIKIQIQSEFIE